MTLADLKKRIEDANALGVKNLKDKGVTTDGTETTYQIMSKIADVVIGGGGETTGRQSKTGTFELNTSTTTPEIAHNCEFVPTLFIVYPKGDIPTELTTENQMILGCIVTNTNYFSNVSVTNTSNAILELKTNGIAWNYSSTKDAILTKSTATLGYAVNARIWKANFQYGWIAIE